MKPIRTWVLVADGGHAKVLEHLGTSSGLVALEDMVFAVELPRTHDLLTDRAGRSVESQGRTRHAIQSPTDPHRELKRAFAKKIGVILQAKLTQGKFDRLVLVAPPPALGDLRSLLPKSVRAKVSAELAHDLVKTPKHRLWSHLEGILALPVAMPAPRSVAPRKRSKK
jgi:protein required for attachment to host cells